MVPEYVIGAALIALGLIGAAKSVTIVKHAARLWPRRYTRADTDLFSTAGWAIYIVSGLLAVTGVFMIWLEAT